MMNLKPSKEGRYLVERHSYSSELWYAVEDFKRQDVYEKMYSQEFKQWVHVLIEEREPSFKDDDDSYVDRWMVIPE